MEEMLGQWRVESETRPGSRMFVRWLRMRSEEAMKRMNECEEAEQEDGREKKRRRERKK